LAPGDSEVVIIAGCWGDGTVAAAEALAYQDFLRNKVVRATSFEMLIETTILKGSHYKTKILSVRPLTPSSGRIHQPSR